MDDVAGPYIAALRQERAGYVARGLTERVAAVDAEIERAGGQPVEEAVTEPAERAGGARPGDAQQRGTGRARGEKRGR